MNIPITQSREWQKLQDDLGETSFLEAGSGYHYLAILKSTPAGKYLYLPYGPIFDSKAGLENALKSLKNLATKHQAVFIRVEPQNPDFLKHLPKNAHKSQDLNPKETWLLDLTGTDESLKDKLPSRLLRYYKSAEKKGITIETSKDPEDIKHLAKLQKSLASVKGINVFSEMYLKLELKQPFATLYLVKYRSPNDDLHRRVTALEGDPQNVCLQNFGGGQEPAGPVENIIAAGLVFDDGTTRYNLQGAQSEQGRKLHATGILTIKLILDAKEKGLKAFDFWGIAPEDAGKDHPWAGFTAFKKTFAGYEKDYAGTYDLVLKPLKYRLYQIFRKLNRWIRR